MTAFSNALYRNTETHITIEESTLRFSNNMPCLNKINLSNTLKDIEKAFIQIYTPIKNLKRNSKTDGSPMILVTFSLVSS